VRLHRSFNPLLLGVLIGVAVLAAPTSTVITPDHPDSVQRGITEAYRSGEKRVVIPAGTYYIKPPSAGSHLQFHGMSDFESDARDVHFVFTDQTRGGVEFLNCRSVRLRGASVRFETPPFTQAVVESIAPDGTWVYVLRRADRLISLTARRRTSALLSMDGSRWIIPRLCMTVCDGLFVDGSSLILCEYVK
jgi:hypothetical protein